MLKRFTLSLFILIICVMVNAQGTGGVNAGAKITGTIVD
ncbi:MAG: hypothetical protein JWQ09_5372, partial [Segetibacter sp.]|nr:hypothetical protein [Segetibacter sp.]